VEHGYDNHTATWYTPLRKAAPNAIVTYEQRLYVVKIIRS